MYTCIYKGTLDNRVLLIGLGYGERFQPLIPLGLHDHNPTHVTLLMDTWMQGFYTIATTATELKCVLNATWYGGDINKCIGTLIMYGAQLPPLLCTAPKATELGWYEMNI